MPWFNLVNHDTKNKTATFRISDQIGKDWWTGDGVAAKEFVDSLEALGDVDQITLYINSPGGNVYDGLEIYNNLKRNPANVTVYVDGIAASIASVIAMAGDEIIMPSNTEMMIHNPSTWAVGDSEEMRKVANRLDEVKDRLLQPYINFTNKSAEEISELMDSETYMSAEKAVELGFATKVEDSAEIMNSFNLSEVKERVQAEFKKQVENKLPKKKAENTAAKIIKMCHEQEFSYLASDFVEQNLSVNEVEARLKVASDIKNICASSDLANLTDKLVKNMSNPTELVRIAISDTKAELEQDIDGGLPPTNQQTSKPKINNREVYAKRRSL